MTAADFELAQGTPAGAAQAAAFATFQLSQLEPSVQHLDDIASTRMACALALLDHTSLDLDADSRDALRREVARLTPPLLAFADAWPHVHEIERLLFGLRFLGAQLAHSQNPDAASVKFTAIVDRIRVLLGKIRTAVGDAEGHYDDRGPRKRLATLLSLESTLDTEVRAPSAVSAAASLRLDVVGRLCAIALQIEAAIDRGRA